MQSAQNGLIDDESYNILRLSVISSTPITTRVTAILDHLSSKTDTKKPALVLLAGKSDVSNKVISIVEITNRELASQNTKIYQYTKLTSEKATIKAKPVKKGNDNSDDVFQTMTAPNRFYDAPVLSIYLSDGSVDGLKKQLGEQINTPSQ